MFKRIAIVAIAAAGAFFYWYKHDAPVFDPLRLEVRAGSVEEAFRAHRSGVMVTAEGEVERILDDDTQGSHHQRFILKLGSGQTLLVAHNIDVAPRLKGLAVGATVELHGEYDWNDQGGVVHWTHRDPKGMHEAGWIEYDGRRYE